MFVTRLGHRVASVPLFNRSFSNATVFVRPLYKNPNLLMQISTQLTPVGVAKRQMHNDHPPLPESKPIYVSRQTVMEMMEMDGSRPELLRDIVNKNLEDGLRSWKAIRASLTPDELGGKRTFSVDDSSSTDSDRDLELEKKNKSILFLLRKNMSAWAQFVMEMMPKLRYMKKVSESWRELSDEAKNIYEKMANAYKEKVLWEFREKPEAEQNEILERYQEERDQKRKATNEHKKKTGYPARPLSGYNEFIKVASGGRWTEAAHVWKKSPHIRMQFNKIGRANSLKFKVQRGLWRKEEKERLKLARQKIKKDKAANSVKLAIESTRVDKKFIENGCSKMDSPNEVVELQTVDTKTQEKSVDDPLLMLLER